jgi:hypothetical protein
MSQRGLNQCEPLFASPQLMKRYAQKMHCSRVIRRARQNLAVGQFRILKLSSELSL